MSARQNHFNALIAEIDTVIRSERASKEKLQVLCDILYEQVDHYDWVGFYWVHPEKERMLYLGPYAGAATEHTEIPFGKGICGQAADKAETIVVPDVTAADNYLACSVETKSEVVVPVFRGREVIGELDIDSHQTDPFTPEDAVFLEQLAIRAAELAPV
jgi:GAF domain-containing protein